MAQQPSPDKGKVKNRMEQQDHESMTKYEQIMELSLKQNRSTKEQKQL